MLNGAFGRVFTLGLINNGINRAHNRDIAGIWTDVNRSFCNLAIHGNLLSHVLDSGRSLKGDYNTDVIKGKEEKGGEIRMKRKKKKTASGRKQSHSFKPLIIRHIPEGQGENIFNEYIQISKAIFDSLTGN